MNCILNFKDLDTNGELFLGTVYGNSPQPDTLQKISVSHTHNLESYFKISEKDTIYSRIVLQGVQTPTFQGNDYGLQPNNVLSRSSQLTTINLWLQGERKICENHLKYWIGPNISNEIMTAFKPSNYNPTFIQFRNGGNASLYGSSRDVGFGASIKKQHFGASFGYVNKNLDGSSTGVGREDDTVSLLCQVGTENKLGSISLDYNLSTDWSSQSFFSTELGKATQAERRTIGTRININEGAIGIKGLRMVAGVDRSTSDSATNAEADKTLAYMGAFTLANCLSKEIEIGGALGKRQYATSIVGNDNNDPASDNHVSEIYAELPISDKIGIRFTVFNNFKPYDGTNDYDNYGWTVETKFRKPLLECTKPEGGEDEDQDNC